MNRLACACVAAALLAGGAAAAQERPTEEEMFGAPPPQPAAPGGPPAAEAAPPPPAPGVTKEREDPLRIGGQVYLRAQTSMLESDAPADWGLSSPNLLDVYLDVRPNDRVRGFALGRMSYDPTIGGTPAGIAALAGGPAPANPGAVLDQLWLNFDVGRRVFVTAGKQHVKWGVGRFWNPTDWLHAQRRDPLAVFDVRTGATMVKLHVPWEARGWNLYGVALLEDLDAEVPEPASLETLAEAARGPRLRRVAGGARAEVVLGNVEVGADALLKDGRRPRFGIDVSAGIWELDVYAEAALRTAPDFPRWRSTSGSPGVLGWEEDHRLGFTPAVVAGGEWSARYSDEDVVTVGAEYFFDDSGYSDPAVYPALALGMPELFGLQVVQRDPAALTPFYLGRHYAGAYVRLPSPGRWNDTSFTLSGLGNLSDRSFVVRLDHALLALTYLRVETFVAAHLGSRRGEFRFDVTVSPEDLPALPQPLRLMGPRMSAGVALRVSL